MKRPVISALAFVAIGLLIYAVTYWAAEQLVYRNGHTNPLFKIATAGQAPVDWVVLGASHAMPLDFADFNAEMQRDTSLKILNLASPGTGPLYNRFVLEEFLRSRRTRGIIYVLNSFAFYSRAWNEDRFGDAKLIRAAPFDPATARHLLQYSRSDGVDARAFLDYVSGFSKINNRDRFQRDMWEGEAQFDRVYRPSTTAVSKRIAYLYPQPRSETAFARYLQELAAIIATARRHGARVIAIKLPVPAEFRGRLPGEAAFDEAAGRLLASHNVPFHDLSSAISEPRFFFDTDHLNRSGLKELLARHLKSILTSVPEG